MEFSPDQVRSLIEEHGSQRQAAIALGVPESTLRLRLSEGRPIKVASVPDPRIEVLQNENEALKLRLYELQAKSSKPRIIPGKDGKITRVVAIGDTHDQPGMDKDRFKWIARHCGEVQPDRIVQIGDFADFASVSAHEVPGSVGHASRPRFRDDLESLEEAMAVFWNEIRNCDIPMELTCGNHEDRITRFENRNPETLGSLYSQFEDIAARYRWRTHSYGSHLFIDGVSFVHSPMNQMGKAFGGANCEAQIGNAAMFSIVFGHTHKSVYKQFPKIGPFRQIQVCNLGSAMPQNFIAHYAGIATTGWDYGIYELGIRGGQIVSHRHISMLELEEEYS